METISFADFTKLHMVVGQIVSVEVVPDADRLLKLEVDIGEEQPRQIVSGIREYFYGIEELVGVKTIFLVNLEPRTIRGLESQGMILATNSGDTFALLKPDKDLPVGTPVR